MSRHQWSRALETRSPARVCNSLRGNGRGGIRTHGTLLTYTSFPGLRLKPLGHPSNNVSKLVANHGLTNLGEGRLLALEPLELRLDVRPHALRTHAMAEAGVRVMRDVALHGVPVILVVANLLAIRADREDVLQHLDLG